LSEMRIAAATLPLPEVGAPPVPTVPRPERFTLQNGLRVLAVHRDDLPQVAIRMVIPAGSVMDPADAPGVASLVGALLTEGTDDLSANVLNERIDMLGAALSARVGHDHAEVDLGLLSETLDEGLSLLAAVVSRSAFPERELERVRAETLDALDARLDEPANVADDEASRAVFGADHPYGRLPIGTAEGVSRLKRADLVAFHRSQYRPDGSVLVIGGDLSGPDLRGRLEQAFAGWTGSASSGSYPAAPPALAAGSTLLNIEREEAAQAEIRVAGLGMPRVSEDWVAASVANYILGGSTITGRLGSNLREDKGWTYGVRSGFAAAVQPGGWIVETAVGAEVAADALSEIRKEIEGMVSELVSEEELDRAKEALILSLPRAFETPARVVSRLATLEAYGLDADYWDRFPARVQQVTAADVMRIARTYFAPDQLVQVAVGPRLGGEI
jgi:zinc protease